MSIIRKINNIISEFQNEALESVLSVEETIEKSNEELNNLDSELNSIRFDSVDKESAFLRIANELKAQKTLVFKRCCDEKDMQNSNNAFFKYRIYLEKYNSVLNTYNHAILKCFEGDIADITNEIMLLRTRLLPINNDNVEQHNVYHEHNKKYYEQIEALEQMQLNLLKKD